MTDIEKRKAAALEHFNDSLESPYPPKPDEVGYHNFVDTIRELLQPASSEQEMDDTAIYKGNSVGHWHNKAMAYKKVVGDMCDVATSHGYSMDGFTSVVDIIDRALDQQPRRECPQCAVYYKFIKDHELMGDYADWVDNERPESDEYFESDIPSKETP